MSEYSRFLSGLRSPASLQILLIAAVIASSTAFAHAAEDWRLILVPAANNRDEPVRLIAGHTQQLNLMLQASKEVQASAKTHEVELQFNLPLGVEYKGSGGNYELLDTQEVTKDQRRIVTLKVKVTNGYLVGTPGARPASEWQSRSVFIKMPDSVASGASYIKTTVIAKEGSFERRWDLELHELTSVADKRPKLTTIGFWDYDYNRADEAAYGIGEFFAAAGANFNHKTRDHSYPGFKASGIISGGDVHHGYFASNKFPDLNVHGNRVDAFACPTCTVNAPAGTTIAGISQIIDHAQKFDGIATFDYEPGATVGFCPESIAMFKERHKVSDEDFDLFRAYMIKNGSKTYVTQDAKVAEIYGKWVSYRSWQTGEYVKRIQQEVRAIDPTIKLALTPNPGYDDHGLATMGYGYNAATMAPYVDIIMPQIYIGYGGAGAKLTMEYTRHWREVLDKQGNDTKLWPIILIRYAGASVYNAPSRMRQQIIGTLARGANGVLLYYSSNMDARYWITLAQTSTEVAQFENYYQHGKKVGEQYPFLDMPTGSTEISRYPAHKLTVKDPQWETTAHELEGKVLLTLINLEEANDLVFTTKIPDGMKIVESKNVEAAGQGKWLVTPTDVGFVVLAKTSASAE